MAISKEFLPLFKDFVTNYKVNGTSGYFSLRTKEQNHPEMSQHLEELQEIIASNQEAFHDVSIIEHLNSTVLLKARTNPYLLDCWIEFLKKYNSITTTYDLSGKIHINVGPDKPSEKIIRELQSALSSSMQLAGLAATVHASETAILRKQIENLRAENKQLSEANSQLQQQIQDQTYLRSLEPQIETAKVQVGSFLQLLSSLQEATQKKASVEPVNKEVLVSSSDNGSNSSQSAPAVETAPPAPPFTLTGPKLQVASKESPGPNSSIVSNNKTVETVPSSLSPRATVPVSAPKSPEPQNSSTKLKTSPPPPPPKPAAATISPARKIPAPNQKFFSGQTGDLQKDITSILEGMKAKKTESDPEKKNLAGLPN